MLQLKVQGLLCYNGNTLGFFAKFALHYTLNGNYLNIHIISRKSKLWRAIQVISPFQQKFSRLQNENLKIIHFYWKNFKLFAV